jgi:hypothetical protein
MTIYTYLKIKRQQILWKRKEKRYIQGIYGWFNMKKKERKKDSYYVKPEWQRLELGFFSFFFDETNIYLPSYFYGSLS